MEKSILKNDSASAYIAGASPDKQHSFFQTKVSDYELADRFSHSWIVRRICEGYAKDMTAKGVAWKCESEKALILEKEFRRLHVWSLMTEAITWARLFGGSLLVFDMADGRPEQPLNANGTLVRLAVYDKTEAMPELTQVRHGLPVRYNVSPRNLEQQFTVDASRCIRFVGARVTHDRLSANDFWGQSVVESADQAVKQYDKSIESAIELLKRCYLRWLGIKDFRQSLQNTDEDAYNVGHYARMVNEVQNFSGLTIGDQEDSFQTQTYSFAGIRDVLMTLSEQVAGATHYPLVKLFGMSPSGFSTGDADLENYYADLLSEQEESLREPIARIASLILVQKGMTTEDLDFDFIPQKQTTVAEKVTTAKTATDAILAVREAGIINDSRALEELAKLGDMTGIFATIDDTDREFVKSEPVPEPDGMNGEPADGDVQPRSDLPQRSQTPISEDR